MTPEHIAKMKAAREAKAAANPGPKNRVSLRKAITAKCKDCIYDDHAPGTWRQQTEACTSTDCPLFPVRPISSSPKETSHANSI